MPNDYLITPVGLRADLFCLRPPGVNSDRSPVPDGGDAIRLCDPEKNCGIKDKRVSKCNQKAWRGRHAERCSDLWFVCGLLTTNLN